MLFLEELKELYLGIAKADQQEKLDGAIDTLWAIWNCDYFIVDDLIVDSFLEVRDNALSFCYFYKDQLSSYAKAVSISNWSKFCKDEAEAMQTISAYFNAEHPDKLGKCILSYHKQVGEKWVVFDATTRKVLKSINYITVQDALKTL